MIVSSANSASKALDTHKLEHFPISPDLLSPSNNENTISANSLNSINTTDTMHSNNITNVNHQHPTHTSPSNITDTMNQQHDNLSQHDGNLFLTDDYIINMNEPWGDSFSQKPDNTIRVYFQNIHGLFHQQSWNKWKEIVDMCHHHSIDVAGLVETNLNWSPSNCHTAQ